MWHYEQSDAFGTFLCLHLSQIGNIGRSIIRRSATIVTDKGHHVIAHSMSRGKSCVCERDGNLKYG